YNEVMVTRRVYRNGESEYYINKNGTRLKDIVELFRDTGIGKEGYSIIGQGRIDEILSQKGEDRRQIFEEAAGIVKFKSRKIEAERKLEKTLDNLSRVEDIIEELRRQLEPLEQQAQEAKRYLHLSAELKETEINVFLQRHDQANIKIAQLNQALEGFEAVIDQGEGLVKEKTREKEKMEQEIEDLEEQVTTIRQSIQEKTSLWHEKMTSEERLVQQKERCFEKKEEYQQSLLDLEEKKEQLTLLAEDKTKASWVQQQKVQEGLAKISVLEEKLLEKQQKMEQVQEELEAQKTTMIEAMNRVSMAQNTQTRQKTVLGQMNQRLIEIEQEQVQSKEDHHEKSVLLEQLQKKYSTTLEILNKRKKQVEEIEEVVNALAVQIETQEKGLLEKQREQQAGESRLKLLEEMSRDFEGYYQSVKKALTYAKKKGNPKVHGVVAMLMKVPKQLETAIDMVLGASLQNIVTEDEYTAKEMIGYLRDNKLGRATFLPLNTVKGRTLSQSERKVLTLPGCIGVGNELIAFDPQYGPVMENLLGRTIVAENLDAGIAIMRAGGHGFRLVTLQGDVIHSGGSMTGGSIQSKMTNLLGRQREIEELSKELAENRNQITKQSRLLEELEQERNSYKKQRIENSQQLHQEEIAVARDQERMENGKTDMQMAKNRLEQVNQAHEQLVEGIQTIEEDLKNIEEQTGHSETNQQVLEEKTALLQEKLTQLRENFELAREKVGEKRLSQAEMNHQWDLIQKDQNRAEKEGKQIVFDLEKIKEQQEENEKKIEELTTQLASLEETNQQENLQLKNLEETAEQLEQLRRETQQKARTVLLEIQETQNQTNDLTGKAHRTEIQKTKIVSELENIQERVWNAYELTYGTALPLREEGFDLIKGEKRGEEIRKEIRQLGPVNVNAIEDFTTVSVRYEDLTTQQKDLLLAEKDLRVLIEKLLVQMEEQFLEQFSLLQEYFQETFVRLFGGGKAQLNLEDVKDPLNCGIDIIAQPPGKKLQLLSLLSGGERALTAIAILFAMLKLKPTPFCILDEIEAALDDANINYFADYLAEYSQNTQFVVVTHRKGTMERCDALYGVAMEEKGVSKMVSVNLTDYAS
ncbi:MAG: chromosome segregation protein SMC, partial [Clostridiales bacterium]|nr:chromosome segregation protein SMC [Clostridiales bacterium]